MTWYCHFYEEEIILNNLLTPAEIAEKMLDVSKKKVSKTFVKMLLVGFMGGAFIALGSVAATVMWGTVGDVGIGKFLGAAIFPVGIVMVLITGAELFTGNNLITIGALNGHISWGALTKNWIAIFIGNFLGSVFIAGLVYAGHLFGSGDSLNGIGEMAVRIARYKTGHTFLVAFFRAILCNIVVSLSIWMATGISTVEGKILAVWFPIAAFVMAGYEHIVANMFFIPMGIFLGSGVSWGELVVNNFIPVTLGNIIGGGLIVPVVYHILYLQKK